MFQPQLAQVESYHPSLLSVGPGAQTQNDGNGVQYIPMPNFIPPSSIPYPPRAHGPPVMMFMDNSQTSANPQQYTPMRAGVDQHGNTVYYITAPQPTSSPTHQGPSNMSMSTSSPGYPYGLVGPQCSPQSSISTHPHMLSSGSASTITYQPVPLSNASCAGSEGWMGSTPTGHIHPGTYQMSVSLQGPPHGPLPTQSPYFNGNLRGMHGEHAYAQAPRMVYPNSNNTLIVGGGGDMLFSPASITEYYNHNTTANPNNGSLTAGTTISRVPSGDAQMNGSQESQLVCRHFLEGRCNRRKCRFSHQTGDTTPDPDSSKLCVATTLDSSSRSDI